MIELDIIFEPLPDGLMPDPYDLSTLSTRTHHCLKNWWASKETDKPISAFDVSKMNPVEMLRWPNFGHKSLREIEAWLACFGLKFENPYQGQQEKFERAELARLKAKYEP